MTKTHDRTTCETRLPVLRRTARTAHSIGPHCQRSELLLKGLCILKEPVSLRNSSNANVWLFSKRRDLLLSLGYTFPVSRLCIHLSPSKFPSDSKTDLPESRDNPLFSIFFGPCGVYASDERRPHRHCRKAPFIFYSHASLALRLQLTGNRMAPSQSLSKRSSASTADVTFAILASSRISSARL